MAFTDTRSMQVKLMAGVPGHKSITVHDIKTSFQATGLSPMEFDFAERWKRTSDKLKEEKGLIQKRLETCIVATRLPAVQSRRADNDTYQDVLKIVKSSSGASCKLQELLLLIQRHSTVKSILMEAGRSKSCSTQRSSNEQCEAKNTALPCGAPGEYLTMRHTMDLRRQNIEKAEAAKVLKTQRQLERAAAKAREAQEKSRRKVDRKRNSRACSGKGARGCKKG